MSRVDRYMLAQFLWLFGFFALVLVAIFWINRAVVLFDRLIGDGQSLMVFMEFTALALPRLILTVLPIATFAAAVYVTNRLNNESELTVMQATGWGPWRLARPALLFGLVSALMVTVLAHVLVPAAQKQLSDREREIAQNITARLLTEGAFLSPSAGVTFYTRAIGEDGVLRDVFLTDRRAPGEEVTYTASEAYLLREDDRTTLIMVDGLAQRMQVAGKRLTTATFADFSFDISTLVRQEREATTRIDHMSSFELWRGGADVHEATGASAGELAEEIHSRLARPLFALVTALIGFASLLVGGFSRFGVWREVVLAFGLLILIDGMRGAFAGSVLDAPQLWPVMYLPSLIGLCVVGLLLWIAAHPGWWRRKRDRNRGQNRDQNRGTA